MRILSLAPLAGPGLELLRSLGDVEIDAWNDHVPVKLHSADELTARLGGVTALVVEADYIPDVVFENASLRLLGVARGDPNNVDVPAATKHGVAVIRTPGRNAGGVADLALGFMYGLLRNIVAADDDVRAGRFVVDGKLAQQRYLGRELSSCVVGIVGFGAIGRLVAERLRALGARALVFDPFVSDDDVRATGAEPATLDYLMSHSDIVSVHAPLVPETRGLLGADEFARVKPGALFVNTARYGIAQEEPLLDALRDGRIAGAAFDHFEHEFLAPDHPLVAMPNVILTPHIGGTTVETIENHTMQIATGFHDARAGRVPRGIVNPDVLPVELP
jgi:D-3-phosphoglycerate dehydrogenase